MHLYIPISKTLMYRRTVMNQIGRAIDTFDLSFTLERDYRYRFEKTCPTETELPFMGFALCGIGSVNMDAIASLRL